MTGSWDDRDPRRRRPGGVPSEGPTERIVRPDDLPTQAILAVGAQPAGDNSPTGVIRRPTIPPDVPAGPPVVRATVPQYPVSQTVRFGVVGVVTVLVHALMFSRTPNAAGSGYVQFATLLLCLAVPPTAVGVFLDQPNSKFSRWMLFLVCGFCALVAAFDAIAWIKPILQAKGF